MKKIISTVLLIASIGCSRGHSQSGFSYKSVPATIANKYLVSESTRNKIIAATPNLYDLTNSLPNDYVVNGSVDYTDYLQKGIDENSNVIFPNFPILVNSKGISLKSNSNIIFRTKSKLILKATSTDNYQIIRMYNVKNSRLYYPNIVGDRNQHMGTKGEFGMGISIRGANNVEVHNAKVSNCWGDGIYLDDLSKDITLYSPYVDNNRRNGISIVYAEGVKIYNMLAANTNGTAPMSGIDIEPDNNNNIVNNILLQNPITFNNSNRGVLIVLSNLVGKSNRSVNIDINDHNDIGSNYGVGFYLGHGKSGVIPLTGNINISNPNWSKSRKSPIFMSPDMKNNSVKLRITRPKVDGVYNESLRKSSLGATNVVFN